MVYLHWLTFEEEGNLKTIILSELILKWFNSEYGEEWHRSAMFLKKQNSYDDFHAAAEYLIKKNYTQKNK